LYFKVTFQEKAVSDRDPDLSTLLDDVKTIKAILTNQDAPFPRVWKALYAAAAAFTVVGLVQFFVPFFRSLDFDGRLLWLWLPAFCLMFPVVLAILLRELKVSGKGVLSQGRIRHVLYARWVVPPAALVILWTASRNPVFGVEGVALLLIAIWQTVLEQIVPEAFRPVPLVFLGLGVVELALNLRGDEVVLFNILFTAATIAFAATLLRQRLVDQAEVR